MPDSSPIWDLTDLYADIEDKAIANDLPGADLLQKSCQANGRAAWMRLMPRPSPV